MPETEETIDDRVKAKLDKYFEGITRPLMHLALISTPFWLGLAIAGSISECRADWKFVMIIIWGYILVDIIMTWFQDKVRKGEIGIMKGYVIFFGLVVVTAVSIDKLAIPTASWVDHFLTPIPSAVLWSLFGVTLLGGRMRGDITSTNFRVLSQPRSEQEPTKELTEVSESP